IDDDDEDEDIGEYLHEEAGWDVFFTRLAGIQEYGFHSGIEDLMWASDQLNGALVNLDWLELKNELNERREEWTNMVVEHASKEGKFFTVDEPLGAADEQPQF
ncbi:MAG: hypothetical protein D3909_19755, partial [Candidatus Electrothrix sp. ATG1]|nr:hypothetical protein [Candidatus Electrothrix sp. ATG1]